MVKFVSASQINDARGNLTVVEFPQLLPFECQRTYFLKSLDPDLRRGFHAHHELRQVFFCVQGSCMVLLDDGINKVDVKIEGEKGLIIDKMVWHEMYHFSKDCVIAVFASDVYKESDYIREYDQFLKHVGKK
ncbi:MAG: FdtA/QdtA family cupin domain-containing protein [Bdellovibrio sp.]|nr:FdtA/QdtA family cupin domain-containing protein [Bdellovibrio sp.]